MSTLAPVFIRLLPDLLLVITGVFEGFTKNMLLRLLLEGVPGDIEPLAVGGDILLHTAVEPLLVEVLEGEC